MWLLNHEWANPIADHLFIWVSAAWGLGAVVGGAMLLYLWRRYRSDGIWAFALLIVAVLLADAVGHALKETLQMARPCFAYPEWVRAPVGCGDTLAGMPSNHSATFAAAAVFFIGLLRARWALLPLGLVWLSVVVSRIYLGKHFPTQIVAGAILGTLIGGAFCAIACRSVKPLQRIRRQGVPERVVAPPVAG